MLCTHVLSMHKSPRVTKAYQQQQIGKPQLTRKVQKEKQ